MGLGGPVWHASAAPFPITLWPIRTVLESWAFMALEGVGDARLGEWTDWTGKAFHLRRRLTDIEVLKVGPVVDVRGTPEAARRLAPVRHLLPPDWDEL